MMGCLDKSPLHSYLPGTRDNAAKTLADMGLKEYQDHPFGSLSGGQTQRVLIATGFSEQPLHSSPR